MEQKIVFSLKHTICYYQWKVDSIPFKMGWMLTVNLDHRICPICGIIEDANTLQVVIETKEEEEKDVADTRYKNITTE